MGYEAMIDGVKPEVSAAVESGGSKEKPAAAIGKDAGLNIGEGSTPTVNPSNLATNEGPKIRESSMPIEKPSNLGWARASRLSP